MSRRHRRVSSPALVAGLSLLVAVISSVGAASSVLAAQIHYGDFGPDLPTGLLTYTDIRESSGTTQIPPGRFGAPSLSGNTLDFDPTEFVASGTNGQGQITDVQLNGGAQVLRNQSGVAGGMTSISILEGGDFSLVGSGTAGTAVFAGLSARLDIFEVDGVAIDPFSITVSSSRNFDLAADGTSVVQPWDNGVTFDLGAALAANDISFQFGVTGLEFVMDDQLIALSESGTAAFIAKKDFVIQTGFDANPDFVVPEPSTALLMLGGLAALGWRRQERRD